MIDLFNAVRRRWWLLVIPAIVCGLVGYVFSGSQSPKYRAQVKLLVGPVNGGIDTLRAASQLTDSYVDIAVSLPLREQARSKLHLSQLPPSAISATANDLTRVLTVRAEDDDPRAAARIANTLANELRTVAPRRSGPEGRLRIIDPATPPTKAFAPRVGLITGLCLFAGLVLGGLSILLLDSVSDRVRDEEDLAQLAGAPVLERIGGLRGSRAIRGPKATVAFGSGSREPYELLAAKIAFSNGAGPSRSLLVLGSDGADEIAPFATNLAAAFAHAGREVVLVDADEGGETTRLLELSDVPGLAELLESGPDAGNIVGSSFCRTQLPRLHVIARGTAPLELDEHRVRELLGQLALEADTVVVSASPLSRSPDALVWARATDRAVLVAYRDRSRRSSVANASKSLRFVGADLEGTVLGTSAAGV